MGDNRTQWDRRAEALLADTGYIATESDRWFLSAVSGVHRGVRWTRGGLLDLGPWTNSVSSSARASLLTMHFSRG